MPGLMMAQQAASAASAPIEKNVATPVPAPVRQAAWRMAKACAAWGPDVEPLTVPARPVPVDVVTARYRAICDAANPLGSQAGRIVVMTIGGLALVGAIASLGYLMSLLRCMYWGLRWLRQNWRRCAAW